MRNFRSRNSAKDWARLAAKLGLLFTDPKIRAAVADNFKDGVDHVADMKTGLLRRAPGINLGDLQLPHPAGVDDWHGVDPE